MLLFIAIGRKLATVTSVPVVPRCATDGSKGKASPSVRARARRPARTCARVGRSLAGDKWSKLQRSTNVQTSNEATQRVLSLGFHSRTRPELVLLFPLLLPRIGLRDNQAHCVLIESFEAAFALKVFEVAADRAIFRELRKLVVRD